MVKHAFLILLVACATQVPIAASGNAATTPFKHFDFLTTIQSTLPWVSLNAAGAILSDNNGTIIHDIMAFLSSKITSHLSLVDRPAPPGFSIGVTSGIDNAGHTTQKLWGLIIRMHPGASPDPSFPPQAAGNLTLRPLKPFILITAALLAAFALWVHALRRRMQAALAKINAQHLQLKHSEQKYRTLIETTDTGYVILDVKGRVLDANAEYIGLTGHYSLDEILGKNVLSWTAPHDTQLYRAALEGLLTNRFLDHFEIDHLGRGGEILPIEINAALVEGDDGKQILALCRDIRQRKQAHKALAESEERFRTLAENSQDAIMRFDKGHHFLYANSRVKDLTGLPPGHLSGRTASDLGLPDDLVRLWQETIDLAIETGKTLRREFQLPSGPWIDWLAIPEAGPDGTVRTVLTSARDITKRKLAEEENLRAQKLESLGVLAGGIAHDFNNILSAIMGNISLAKATIAPDDELFDMLEQTEKASLQARDLTRQLLTFAMNGEHTAKQTILGDTIREAVDFALRGSRVRAEFSLAADLWPAEIDTNRFIQVLSNLTLNAIQAMPEGGLMRVRADNVDARDSVQHTLPSRRHIAIAIEDQGPGIPAEDLSRIFDPYFSTRPGLSGLGLATSYSIIKQHGGTIMAQSQPGTGSTFTVYLPASQPVFSEPERMEKDMQATGGKKVLVMDDDQLIQDVLGNMLDHLGYACGFACDGNEALRLYSSAQEEGNPYDLIIMDLTIPGGMGGKETIARLLEIDPAAKAIVSSGYSNDPIVTNYRDYGFSGVITKPFKIEDLTGILDLVIHDRR